MPQRRSSLPDIYNTDQLSGDEPQRERIQQEGEDAEHHLRSMTHKITSKVLQPRPNYYSINVSYFVLLRCSISRVPVTAHYTTRGLMHSSEHPGNSFFTSSLLLKLCLFVSSGSTFPLLHKSLWSHTDGPERVTTWEQ